MIVGITETRFKHYILLRCFSGVMSLLPKSPVYNYVRIITFFVAFWHSSHYDVGIPWNYIGLRKFNGFWRATAMEGLDVCNIVATAALVDATW